MAASDGHHLLLIGTAPGASPLPVLSAAAVMALAMMSPLALPGVWTVAGASRWWRAGRAVVWFFVASAAGWVVAILPLAVIAGVLAGWLGATTAGVALLVGCAALSLLPGRAIWARACDRPARLRDRGRLADADCARFGVLTVLRDLPLCGPPMLAMLVAPGGLVLMAAIGGLTLVDRIIQGRAALLVAGGYVAIAAAVLLV